MSWGRNGNPSTVTVGSAGKPSACSLAAIRSAVMAAAARSRPKSRPRIASKTMTKIIILRPVRRARGGGIIGGGTVYGAVMSDDRSSRPVPARSRYRPRAACRRPAPARTAGARRDLRDDLAHPGHGQRALLLDQRQHIAPGHQAHRDVQDAAGLAGIEDRHDVRVVDRGRGPGLPD